MLLMTKPIRIAIDGPAGAGKSTIAKLIARRLNILYLDTGAMYRAIALKCIENNIAIKDREAIEDLLESTELQVIFIDNRQRIVLDGRDISDKIRTTEVSSAASSVAIMPEVRKKLMDIQRDIASKSSVVMDGRDIGTHVLPNADIKIFLTASLEERARRRHAECADKGEDRTLEDIKKEIENRDRCDSTREFAPLKMADDALLVDTTGRSIEQVANIIIDTIDNEGTRN